jgi:hypothetical protein
MLKSKLLFVIGLIVLLNSCSSVKAPLGTVPVRNALATDTFGGWIELSLISPKDSISGEFIATSNDSLYIMDRGEVKIYAVSNISLARLVIFKNMSSTFGAWTFLGSLLTISNGAFLLFTLPTTLIMGISTTIGEAKRINFLDYPSNSIENLSKYARFPQGIPEGLNIADLRPRRNLNQ